MTRLADVNDIPKILPLLMDYRTFYGVKTQDVDEAERFLHERLSKSESIVFVTFHEGEAVGFIQLYPSFSTVSLKRQWHLNDLFVKEEYRRKGYASELMESAKEYFKGRAKGFTLITEKTNVNAKAFYKANGWQTDEYDFYTFFYK
jgi:ribosomal protein S18 acetylase RimI-like enzyme